jgi:hypothetical protein
MIQKIISEDCQDVKTLNLLYQLIHNICITDQNICTEMVNKTGVVDSLLRVFQTHSKIKAEFYENILHVMSIVLRHCDLDEETLICFLDMAINCLKGARKDYFQFFKPCKIILSVVNA